MSIGAELKRSSLVLASVLLLCAACDSVEAKPAEAPAKPAEAEAKPAKSAEAKPAAPQARGKFVGTIGKDEVAMEVDCKNLDQPFFQFQSDKFDHKDSDGDGIVLSGMEHDGKFVLTYIVNDFTLSTAKLDEFEKSATGAKGSGTLHSEDATQKKQVSFELTCP